MRKRLLALWLVMMLVLGSFAACNKKPETGAAEPSTIAVAETESKAAAVEETDAEAAVIPALTEEAWLDYADPASWMYLESEASDKRADVFFVDPTVYMGDDSHYQLVDFDEKVTGQLVGSANMEKGIYDQDARFFAPFYHQAALNAYYIPDEVKAPYFDSAYGEICKAFEYYLENYNEGRPIILAGFSQGGEMVIRLLKDYFKDEALNEQLIACYAIGWRITDEELAENPHIRFAEGESDTGVLIAFNSESEDTTESLLIPAGVKTRAINPLNWATDGTVAEAELNKGACFTNYDGEITKEIPAFTGAYIDDVRGALKVPDVDKAEYPAKLFPEGVFHIYDYQFFYRNLQENVLTRMDSYFGE